MFLSWRIKSTSSCLLLNLCVHPGPQPGTSVDPAWALGNAGQPWLQGRVLRSGPPELWESANQHQVLLALALRCVPGNLASVLFSEDSPKVVLPGAQLIPRFKTVLQPCSQKQSLTLTPRLGTPTLFLWSPDLIASQASRRFGSCLLLTSTSWKLPVAKTTRLVAQNLKSIAV